MHVTPDGRYHCTRTELEALLHDTCVDFADTLGAPLNEPEFLVLNREIARALDYWHASATPVAPTSEDS